MRYSGDERLRELCRRISQEKEMFKLVQSLYEEFDKRRRQLNQQPDRAEKKRARRRQLHQQPDRAEKRPRRRQS